MDDLSDKELESLERWRQDKARQLQEEKGKRRRLSWHEGERGPVRIVRRISPSPEKLTDFLGSFLQKTGLNKPHKGLQIRRFWTTVVGSDIASRTNPVRFQKGVLTVEVSSPALRQELETFYKNEILESLKGTPDCPVVREIRFRLKAD